MDSLNQNAKPLKAACSKKAGNAYRLKAVWNYRPPVLHQDDWHQGVVGLVASRIKEQYHRPVFAFAESSDDELKALAVSIPTCICVMRWNV